MTDVRRQGFIATGGKNERHMCSYCERDATGGIRIRCAECPSFELCGDCFASGVELYPHKNTHKYRVVDCLAFPVFDKAWTADEELLLLEGIERFGPGNWKVC
jgi:transcriptional adapter 2-alpha